MDNFTTAHIPGDLVEQINACNAELYIGDDWTAKAQRHLDMAQLFGRLTQEVEGDASRTVWLAAFAAQDYHESRAALCTDAARDEQEDARQ